MALDWTALAAFLSKMAENRAKGKVAQADIDAQNNQNATSRYQALVNAGRLQNIEQPAANARQTQIGSLLSSFQPVSLTHPRATMPTITGGPSITPEMRQMGSELTRSALLRQMGGNELDTSTFPSDSALGLNGTDTGKGGIVDKLLSGGSTAAGLLSILLPKGTATTAGAAGSGAAGGLVSGNPTTSLLAPQGKTPSFGMGGGAGAGSPTAPGGVPGLQDMANRAQLGALGLGPSDYNYIPVPEEHGSTRDRIKINRGQRRSF